MLVAPALLQDRAAASILTSPTAKKNSSFPHGSWEWWLGETESSLLAQWKSAGAY
jgi:hypothetical protein